MRRGAYLRDATRHPVVVRKAIAKAGCRRAVGFLDAGGPASINAMNGFFVFQREVADAFVFHFGDTPPRTSQHRAVVRGDIDVRPSIFPEPASMPSAGVRCDRAGCHRSRRRNRDQAEDRAVPVPLPRVFIDAGRAGVYEIFLARRPSILS